MLANLNLLNRLNQQRYEGGDISSDVFFLGSWDEGYFLPGWQPGSKFTWMVLGVLVPLCFEAYFPGIHDIPK